MLAGGTTDYFSALANLQNEVNPKMERVKNCAMEGLSAVLYDAALKRVRKDKNLSEDEFRKKFQNELSRMTNVIKMSGRKICLPPDVVQGMIKRGVISHDDVDYNEILNFLGVDEEQFQDLQEELEDMDITISDDFVEQCIQAAKLSLVYDKLSSPELKPKLEDLEAVCKALRCKVVEYNFNTKSDADDKIFFQPRGDEKFIPSVVLKDNKINRELLKKYQKIKSKFRNVNKVTIGKVTVSEFVKLFSGFSFAEPKVKTSNMLKKILNYEGKSEDEELELNLGKFDKMSISELQAELKKQS